MAVSCLSARGWGLVDRGCLHRANNGLQTSQPGTKGCLSMAGACVPGRGWAQPGRNREAAVALVTSSGLRGGEGWGVG